MTYRWRHLLNQLPIGFDMRSDRRLRPMRLKHAQFISHLEDSGFRSHDVDHHERSLRRRRLVKTLLLVATTIGAAWVVLESARAVVLF